MKTEKNYKGLAEIMRRVRTEAQTDSPEVSPKDRVASIPLTDEEAWQVWCDNYDVIEAAYRE